MQAPQTTRILSICLVAAHMQYELNRSARRFQPLLSLKKVSIESNCGVCEPRQYVTTHLPTLISPSIGRRRRNTPHPHAIREVRTKLLSEMAPKNPFDPPASRLRTATSVRTAAPAAPARRPGSAALPAPAPRSFPPEATQDRAETPPSTDVLLAAPLPRRKPPAP